MAIWDKICCTLAALGGCTLNRGSFVCKIVRGDMQLAAKGRGTLNRGGRNCRWDCIFNYLVYCKNDCISMEMALAMNQCIYNFELIMVKSALDVIRSVVMIFNH